MVRYDKCNYIYDATLNDNKEGFKSNPTPINSKAEENPTPDELHLTAHGDKSKAKL